MILLAALLAGCALAEDAVQLRFADATSIEALNKLDGKQVSIIGYMATLSPIRGDYMYLMNLPYQSCPFCVPHTTQLANTMAVYAKGGKKFEYTDQAIRVTGKLEMGDFTDDFGYEYGYRIVDAVYEVVDLSDVSPRYALWQSIASDGIVAEINQMFDYLYFLCNWPDYQVNYTDENGNAVSYYLYPGDAQNYLADDSAYGYARFAAEDYFPGLIRRVNAISSSELTELTDMLTDAKILEQYALSELQNGAFQYHEDTDTYTLNSADLLNEQFDMIYQTFSEWLAGWEL